MAERPSLRLPPTASADEAAAITVAVEQLLAREAAESDPSSSTDDAWTGRRFAFAGRMAKVTGEAVRLPTGAPADPWTAAGRRDRF